MTKETKIKTYYSLLVIAVALKVVFSLYQGGFVIHHTQTLSLLEERKIELQREKAQLTKELANTYSIAQIERSLVDSEEYRPIGEPLRLNNTSTIARMQ